MSRNIVYKVNDTTKVLTKLTNVTPIKENNQTDISYLLAPYGADTVMLKLLPNKFFELTNVNPIPAFKTVRITDQEVIDAIVPDGDGETGWYLYYFPIGIGVSGILKSNRATQYQVSYQRLEVDLTDDDYIGNYATASTVDATISTELDVAYPSAVEGNYVNVYKTTSNEYTSWLLVSTTWVDQDELTNETLIDNTLVYNETFKATTVSNDEFNIGTPSEQALVFNQIYGELDDINTVVSAIVGDVAGLMTKAEFATNGESGVVDIANELSSADGFSTITTDSSQMTIKHDDTLSRESSLGFNDGAAQISADTTINLVANSGAGAIGITGVTSIAGATDITGDLDVSGSVTVGTKVISDNTTDDTLDVALNANVTGQMFQEELTKVINNSGVNIVNGNLVYISGSSGTTAEITLATNAVKAKAHATLGMATEDIDDGADGFVTRGGLVRGIDTVAYAAGTALYLGVDGAYTSTKPTPPTFLVEVGIVVKSGGAGVGSVLINIEKVHKIEEAPDVLLTSIAAGEILVRDSGNDYFENVDGESIYMSRDIQNGAFKESFDLRYATSTMTLTNADGVTDSLTMQFSDGDTSLDTTSLSLAPTFGTTTVPQKNYYYILKSAKVLAVSTSAFPSDEHIKVGEITLLDETFSNANGPIGNQNHNNHEKGTNDLGTLQHIREKLRSLGTKWDSGVAGGSSGEWVTPSTLYWVSTAGSIWQMHKQSYAVKDTSGTDIMQIVNDFTTPYDSISSFNEITTYSDGSTIPNNAYYNVFVYGVINKTSEFSPVMINTPSGGYTNITDAQTDLNGTMVTTVPTDLRRIAFPIARILIKNSATPSFEGSYDLREERFGVGGTTGTGVLDGEFIDTSFELQYVSDNTSIFKFSAANISTATTRTLTMADQDVDMAADVLDEIDVRIEEDLTVYPAIAAASVANDDLARVPLDDNGTSKHMTLTEIYAGANTATGSFVASTDYASSGLGAYKSAMLTYHDLTLVTAGDYKVDIKTQITDQIVYVLFPTITSNTNDLRISTDDGVTYYDVLVNGGNIYAELVSTKLVKLQFDGSNWLIDFVK
jgi:hypothetical protein